MGRPRYHRGSGWHLREPRQAYFGAREVLSLLRFLRLGWRLDTSREDGAVDSSGAKLNTSPCCGPSLAATQLVAVPRMVAA